MLYLVPYLSPDEKKVQREAIVFFTIYSVLFVIYSVIMSLLYSSIKELNNSEKFSKTQCEVIVQYTIFLLAFIAKLGMEAVIFFI